MKKLPQILSRVLILAGIMLLVGSGVVVLGSRGYQAYQNWAYFNAPAPPRSDAASQRQTIVGRLEIPRLKVSVMILEGVGESELLLGAGHIPGTALPGPSGNVGIAAHRDTYFRSLREIRAADEIHLATRDGVYRYVVESMGVTDPADTSVLRASEK